MDFKDLADYCQAQALADKLYPSDEAVWRQFCRKYSQAFFTPLHLVEQLEPSRVLLAVYEDQLEGIDVEDNMEDILDIIYTLEDPEYAKQKRDELKDFIKEAEEEEEERQRLGKPIHKALADEVSIKKTLLESTPPENKNLPQGGGLNTSYLENLDRDEGNGEF